MQNSTEDGFDVGSLELIGACDGADCEGKRPGWLTFTRVVGGPFGDDVQCALELCGPCHLRVTEGTERVPMRAGGHAVPWREEDTDGDGVPDAAPAEDPAGGAAGETA